MIFTEVIYKRAAPCRDSSAAAAAAGLQSGGGAVDSAVWDGSIFSVAERLEPGEGFGPPAVSSGAAQPLNTKATGVSFGAQPASAVAAARLESLMPQPQQDGSPTPGRLRSALRQPQRHFEITPVLDDGEFAMPPDASRERLTTEDGNGMEPQPLLAGQHGSPKRGLPGMRQRGSSYETSPSASGSDEDGAGQLPARFVSELRPSTASAASAAAAGRSPGGAAADDLAAGADDVEAGLALQRDDAFSGQRVRGRRESDLSQLLDTGEQQPAADVAAGDSSVAARAEAHYKE